MVTAICNLIAIFWKNTFTFFCLRLELGIPAVSLPGARYPWAAFTVVEVRSRDDKKDLTIQLGDQSWTCITGALTTLQPFILSGEQYVFAMTWACGVAILGLVTMVPKVAGCGAYQDAELHMQTKKCECIFSCCHQIANSYSPSEMDGSCCCLSGPLTPQCF